MLGSIRQRYGVGYHQGIQCGSFYILDCRPTQNRVGCISHDALGTMILQCFCGLAQGARGIDHVVHDKAASVFYVTDDVHDLRDVGLGPPLVDDCQVGVVQPLRHGPGTHHAAHVRGDHDEVLEALLLDVFEHDRGGVNIVHRNVEEALDLVRVQVDGQHSVHADAGDHVGDDLGADGDPGGAHTTVLTGIAVIGDNGGDACGGSAAQGVGHHDQFHQVVVGGVAGGLDDENIVAPHIFVDLDGGFAIAEPADGGLAHGNVEFLGDGVCQLWVGIAGENHQFGHDSILLSIGV